MNKKDIENAVNSVCHGKYNCPVHHLWMKMKDGEFVCDTKGTKGKCPFHDALKLAAKYEKNKKRRDDNAKEKVYRKRFSKKEVSK